MGCDEGPQPCGDRLGGLHAAPLTRRMGVELPAYPRRRSPRVGLQDVRIHDLRRTAASWLAINGSNLPVIQQMLNHRSLSSTQVYARLSVAPVRLALDDQAERMLGPVSVVAPEQVQEWPG